ncbi:MAG UNVERIFIED_CONTAM: hypothetical protein LVR29_12625 [Microcystis novacekii LVE1205-3]|jgi:hypothetical protein
MVHLNNDCDSAAKTASFSSSRSEPVDFASSIIDLNEPQLVMELPFAEPASSNNNPSNSPQIPAYDPFEIRLEIFQYTNPLRAKILIFSLLFHHWDRSRSRLVNPAKLYPRRFTTTTNQKWEISPGY